MITARKMLMLGAVALIVAAGTAAAASAQIEQTPKNYPYYLKDGKPVRKPVKVVQSDGTTREETRIGKCVSVKETLPNGDVRRRDECQPN
jgi:hypothetical protein